MHKSIHLITAALALLYTAHANAQVGRLEPKAFKTEVDKGTSQLIDVRTPEEFVRGHLAGAVNIDWLAGSIAIVPQKES